MVIIDSYRFGEIIINGQPYQRDVKILGETIIPNWWRKEGHYLRLIDLPELNAQPEAVVIGTGKYGRLEVAPEVMKHLKRLQLPFFVAITEEAVKQFNELARQGKRVLGAFHLTC